MEAGVVLKVRRGPITEHYHRGCPTQPITDSGNFHKYQSNFAENGSPLSTSHSSFGPTSPAYPSTFPLAPIVFRRLPTREPPCRLLQHAVIAIALRTPLTARQGQGNGAWFGQPALCRRL